MRKLRFLGILLSFALLSANMLLAGLVLIGCSDPSSITLLNEEGADIEAFDPDYEGITSSGFSIKSSNAATVSSSPDTGQTAEYAVSKNTTTPAVGWQKGLEFTGLDSGTIYYVWARSEARETSTTIYSHGTAVKGEKTVTTTADARGLLDTLNDLTFGAAELSDDNTVTLTGKVELNEALEIEEGIGLIIDGVLAELNAKSFEISGAGLLEVSNGTLKAEDGKIAVDCVFKPGAKYIRMSGTPQVSETVIGVGGKIELENDPPSDNAINLRNNGDGYDYSVSGNAVIKAGKIFTLKSQDTLSIEEDAALTVNGTLKIEGDGRLNIEGTVDIGAGKWTDQGASVTLADNGTFIVPSGADAAALNAIITAIKEIDRGTGPDYSGNVVIQLTQAFYKTAATGYIAVDPGINENTIPYTIRGRGKDNSVTMNNSVIPKLGVGIWLANNNVTLEDVSFKITTVTAGLVPMRPWTIDAQGNVNSAYGVAVLLGRAKDGDGEAVDYLGGSKNVTIQNCAVAITGGSAGESFTGGIWVYGSPSDIRILENTVNVTGKGGNAAQALAFDDWGDNIQVKNNKLSARFANQPDLPSLNEDDFYIRPASAFYIKSFYEKPETGVYNYTAGDISGNALSYDPTKASVFSFYISAYPRPLPQTTNDSRKGVEAMGSKKFGDPETKWALDAPAIGDFHRLVVGDLINDCKTIGDGTDKNGFGAVLMYVSYKAPDNTCDNNVETYTIANEKLTNIGIFAWTLIDGDYVYDSTGVDADVAVNADGTTTLGDDSHMRYWY